MNKKQWKAVSDFCKEYGYDRPSDLLQDLKAQGVVDRRDTLDDLGGYPNDDSYDAMKAWLEEN